MSKVYSFDSYAGWVAANGEARHRKQIEATTSVGLYAAWSGIAWCRAGAFVEAITNFFRTHASFSLTAPVVLTGMRHTCSQVGVALGTLASMAEMTMTCYLFGTDADNYRSIRRHLTAHEKGHNLFTGDITQLKKAAHAAKYERRCNNVASDFAIPDSHPPSTGSHRACPGSVGHPAHSNAELARFYFEYKVAHAELPEATSTFRRSLVMFLRDGPLQGGAVGCNLALLWQGFKISDLLHIVTVPINAVATAIGGAAFSAACGIFHIVGGVLARSEGLQKLAAALRAKDVIDNAIRTIEGIKAEQNAEVEEAVAVGAALLQHAAKNEENAQDSARKQVFVGKWRIGYGTTAIAIAAGSLTFFLLAGGMSTGGLLFAVAGALFLAGWVAYAAYRNGKDASKLKDATTVGSGTTPAMTLEQTIERAVAYLDRTGGIGKDNRDGRRIIKHALRDIGMDRSDFWALRFCSDDPAVKGPVIDTLKVLIHNHVDGDGARRALQQSPAAKKPAKDKATA